MVKNSYSEDKILKATCHGWYPSTGNSLKKMIDSFFSEIDVDVTQTPAALIEPHAGYVWSGKTASYGYKLLLNKQFKRVFILGPAHRVSTDKIILPESDYFQTPLGSIAIDEQVKSELLKTDLFTASDEAFYGENGIEMQIPFLQATVKNCKIIPLIVGSLDKTKILKAAGILKQYYGEDTLFVISSDFTHYGYNYGYTPFEDNHEENIRKLDYGAIDYIKKLDSDGFLSYKQKTGATICGYIPIAILLNILPRDIKTEVLKYDTLGQMRNDFSTSVSYATIAFYKNTSSSQVTDKNLSEEEKKSLLKLSRSVLEAYIKEGKTITPKEAGIKLTENMKQTRGVFVTLNKHHKLRGCIGDIQPTRELYKAVIARTIDSAVNDYRFPQVSKEELDDITIEISALTTPQEVASYEDIVIGRDGIFLIKGPHGAVFLPQVATEQGWDLETTLIQLSLKARLDPSAWEKDTTFLTFQAEVFSEE
ncbi:MAG: AmmeMemoRadiSam system protein B [Candidatus Saelkia tenebricola]|nr:AmmeMemoRadiSam system protein B [Candidatus Saelkia tenebricola]